MEKGYLKQKLRNYKSVKGSATLNPPSEVDVLQSSASMSVVDNIGEGPIYGLVDAEGKKVNNINILEALFLDGTAVKPRETQANIQLTGIPVDNIQLVGRVTETGIEQAFENIKNNLFSAQHLNTNNRDYNLVKSTELASDLSQLKTFIAENNSLNRYGFIQFDLSGIYDYTDSIYSRTSYSNRYGSYLQTTFDLDVYLNDQKINRKIQNEDGQVLNIPECITYGYQVFNNNIDYTTSPGKISVNIGDGKVGDKYLTSGFAGGGILFFDLGLISTSELDSTPDSITETKVDPPQGMRNYSDWHNYDNLHNQGRLDAVDQGWSAIKSNVPNSYAEIDFGEKLNVTGVVTRGRKVQDPNYAQWVTSYKLSGYSDEEWQSLGTFIGVNTNQTSQVTRYLTGSDGNRKAYELEKIRIYPTAYNSHPTMKWGVKIATSGFQDSIDTGNILINKTDASLETKLENAKESGLDVFLHDGTNFSLHQSTPNQIEPAIGETNGLQINLGFQSDLDSKYNYSNIDFDFRNGLEFQPVLPGYEEGAQDFDIRKKLYGPLSYAGNAKDGAGSGFLDLREGGEFSNWSTNPPLEHDSYPYTHTIKRIGVKRAIPTVAIEGLSDTIDDGDNAGVQKAERLDLEYTYGFEGGVVGTAGSLLSGGNSIKEIALGTFESSETQQFEGIVTSNYLNTYNGISDLPRNKSLKNLKIDAADIPGLTNALLAEFDLTSGDLIFPGEEWKVPNRFLRVEKLSFETNSTLILRECSLSYVTEIIGEKFSYPFSALGATTFDARNFAMQPSREYLIRGREIMIPSNYCPLNPDGSDKRFIGNSNTYGLRDIYKFNGSSRFQATNNIDISTENCEIYVKFKMGDFASCRIFSAYDSSNNLLFDLYWQSDPIFAFRVIDDNGLTNNYTTVPLTGYEDTDNIFEISVKLVGAKVTVSMYVNGVLEKTNTRTHSPRASLDIKNFYIGGFSGSGNIKANSKIADLKIKKNNQLLHHWDGTIIDTVNGKALKDRFGGNHAKLIGTFNTTEEDTDFEFGKNKAQVYIGEWDGTFKLGWTDNPAWILYDLMINPVYGIGNNIDDREDINIFNLYSIARYCDAVDSEGLFDGVPDSTVGLEPRFSCNLRISQAKNAFETLGNLASVFRGFTYWDGLGLNFAIDKPKEITAIFNNGNVFDGLFNYGDVTSSARFTRVEVNYADAKDEYTQKVEYVEDEDRIRQYGIITNVLNGIGTTSKSQARRMGKYVLLSNKLETELVQFKAGLEAIFLEPGDIIRIDDELKNFEINYGKILDVSSATPNPYIDIENTVNIGSIQTGISGGLYAYNDKKQNELKDLYDIANFDTVYTFGEDSDVYSGVINNGMVDQQTQERITKFNITGKESRDNSIRLFLDTGFANYDDITGVKAGSFFNVELDNDVNFTYKVVKKSQIEPNIFQIDAMQYVSKKFDLVEDEDFDIEESSYNIGIPSNTINRPSAPTVVSNAFQENNLTYSITGEITAAADSNETSYRVVLYRTNQSGPYLQKEFQRESDDITSFKMFGLVDGNYTVKVTALRNPESSTTFTSDFTISPLPNIYTHNLIESINLDDESNASYQRISGSGSGNGSTIDRDVIYQFGFADMKGRSYSIERFDQYTLDIYALSGSDYNLVRSGHGLDTFKFTEFKNNEMFGSFQTQFQLKFELKESGTLVDSAFYDTTII